MDKPGPSAPPRCPSGDAQARREHITKGEGPARRLFGGCTSPGQFLPNVHASPKADLVDVLLTIPVYNEAERIKRTVVEIECLVHKLANRFQVTLAIAEDGSNDGTKELLQQLRTEGHIFLLSTKPEKMGRGWALRTLWQSCSHDIYAFCDADLSSDLTAIIKLLESIQGGYDVAIASRYVKGAYVNRPVGRRFVSLMYNSLIRAIFKTGIADHQCGLKAFSRTALVQLLPLSKENSWFWDTEMIVLSQRLGLSIVELPISWIERKTRRTEIRRLISDVYLHGSGIIRLKGNSQDITHDRTQGQ